jgi:hypothetical protein
MEQVDMWRAEPNEANRSKRLTICKAAKALDVKNVDIATLSIKKTHLEI